MVSSRILSRRRETRWFHRQASRTIAAAAETSSRLTSCKKAPHRTTQCSSTDSKMRSLQPRPHGYSNPSTIRIAHQHLSSNGPCFLKGSPRCSARGLERRLANSVKAAMEGWWRSMIMETRRTMLDTSTMPYQEASLQLVPSQPRIDLSTSLQTRLQPINKSSTRVKS